MPNNFLLILELMRLNQPTGYLLVFFPAFWGLALASEKIYDLKAAILFFIGGIIARGAGCIINDLLDQKFDEKVERTKNRPLASGRVSRKEAVIALYISLIICLGILLTLSITSIIIGIIAFFLILVYPLMKRFTYFPQVFLGIVFNLGCLISYANLKNSLHIEVLILYLGCCFWTISYDTIYGFIDIKDDPVIGIKSLALFLKKRNYKLWLILSYFIFIILFYLATTRNNLSVILILAALFVLIWQVMTLDIKNPLNCMKKFKLNNLVGFLLCLSICSPFLQ
jgi:4-hydroxybenzoate polyprenyltransferase